MHNNDKLEYILDIIHMGHINVCQYSGPPPIRPPLETGKSGLIRGVASREEYIRYTYTRFVL